MSENRETTRDYLASLLEASLVTSLEIVQEVYNRKVDNPEGQSPIVAVLSAGSERPGVAFGTYTAVFHFIIQIWVLYSDPTASPPWTEALAEDRLDEIEMEVFNVIENNDSVSGYWDELAYTDRSTVADVTTRAGDAYILERIPVAAAYV